MIFKTSLHKKGLLLALVALIVLSLCPIDHLMPMAEAATHSETTLAECHPDVCATLESKKMASQEKITQIRLLLVPVSIFISFQFQNQASRFVTNGDNAPPPTSNKLYHLHAIYLI